MSPHDATHALLAAETFLGYSEEREDAATYATQATAAALVSIAYSLARIADTLESGKGADDGETESK